MSMSRIYIFALQNVIVFVRYMYGVYVVKVESGCDAQLGFTLCAGKCW